jgi:hypothetical protein
MVYESLGKGLVMFGENASPLASAPY